MCRKFNQYFILLQFFICILVIRLWLSCHVMSVMVVFKCVHDFINNRLRLESVTPMALMHGFGKLMGFMACYNLPHFTLQSASFYAMKWYELRGNLLDFILHYLINRVILSN